MKNIFYILMLMLIWFNSWAQCPATVTITGTYSTIYTGSNSWIASSGTTTIPTGADVTLDANPLNNGYVLLDTGFETFPNSTFLAVVLTPCSLLGIDDNATLSSLLVYPNPTNDFIKIEAQVEISKIELFDIEGRNIISKSPNIASTILSLADYSSGIYLLRVTTPQGSSTKKIVKN